MESEEHLSPKLPELPSNYLERNIDLRIEFDDEVLQWLPEVTPEDIAADQERYIALIGEVRLVGGNPTVRVRAVLENKDFVPGTSFYEEGKGSVTNINIRRLKGTIRKNLADDEEYGNCIFVGDIHTHPYSINAPESEFAHEPSPEDIADIRSYYEDGDLDETTPAIFGIAALDDDGETSYHFFRMFREKTGELMPMTIEPAFVEN